MFCKANMIHGFINSFLLISALAAFSSISLSKSAGRRIDMTSLSCFCGINYAIGQILPLHNCIQYVTICMYLIFDIEK